MKKVQHSLDGLLEDADTLVYYSGGSFWGTLTSFDEEENDDVNRIETHKILHCSVTENIKEGDELELENERYYADEIFNTGIGLLEIRLKCTSTEGMKFGISFGNY